MISTFGSGDRDLWFFYLEALGFDGPQSGSVLGRESIVTRKWGEEAFKGYTEAHGPLASEMKDKILGFLKIKTLADLETAFAPYLNEKLSARLAVWRKVLAGLAAMNLADFVTVDLGVVRGLAYYTGFVFEAFDRKATCARWPEAAVTTISSRNWVARTCRRSDLRSAT